MANIIKQARGIEANMPTLEAGQFYFCTDTKEVYIGDGVTNYLISGIYNLDGGTATSVYTVDQAIDGGASV